MFFSTMYNHSSLSLEFEAGPKPSLQLKLCIKYIYNEILRRQMTKLQVQKDKAIWHFIKSAPRE